MTYLSGRMTDGGFLNLGIPQDGLFTMKYPTKIDDLGVPLFQETTLCSLGFSQVVPQDIAAPLRRLSKRLAVEDVEGLDRETAVTGPPDFADDDANDPVPTNSYQ